MNLFAGDGPAGVEVRYDVVFEFLVVVEGEVVIVECVGEECERQLGWTASAVAPFEASAVVGEVGSPLDGSAFVVVVCDDGTLSVDSFALIAS